MSSEQKKQRIPLKEKFRYAMWGALAVLSILGIMQITERGTFSKLLFITRGVNDETTGSQATSRLVSPSFVESKASPIFPEGNKNDSLNESFPSRNVDTTGSDFQTRTVYYIALNDAGEVRLSEKQQVLPTNDSDMQATLLALFNPSTTALNQDSLQSLIPANSSLLHFDFRDGIVYLDMNDSFQFNELGAEGMAAQLAQIVYTMTEFEEVQGVQFLIEGQILDYLSPGIYTGAPLSRNDFQF